MSTFRNPVGPQSPRVYWRRRLVVLLGLLAVIVIVVLLVVRPGSGDAANAPTASPSATPTAEPSSEPSASPSASTAPVAGAACDPAAVKLEAITDTNVYASDQLPQLAFRITNTGSVSCTINLGTTQQAFIVTSGEEQYWSSRDCLSDQVDAAVTLEPNVPQTSTPIPWDRTRSATTTCATERTAVPAGGATYNLTVAIGDIQSNATSFLLN